MRDGGHGQSWHGAGRAIALAAATATVVLLAGGDAFWLCVPAALIAGAIPERAGTAALAGAAVLASAGLAATLTTTGNQPSTVLAVAVPAGSLAVLLATRARLERDRDRLRRSALTDPLTRVANRRSLLERIEYEIARHTRTRRNFALVMLDLDGFKPVNDRFGHGAGDDLLREVADALTRAVREQDTVARIGGDEFCLLAPETGRTGAQRLQSRAAEALGRITAGASPLSAGAGVAVFPDDGTTAQRLMGAADQRLLAAKRGGASPERRAA